MLPKGRWLQPVAQNFNEAAAASGQEMVRTNSAHPDSQLRHFSIQRYACLMNIKKSQVYSWHSRC
jgi:hypothetical protein